MHDRLTGATVRVSVTTSGEQIIASGLATPRISGSGRFVAFGAAFGATPGTVPIVHDRDADEDDLFDEPGGTSTTWLDLSAAPVTYCRLVSTPSVSDNGQFVAFGCRDLSSIDHALIQDRDPDGNGTFDEAGSVTTIRFRTELVGSVTITGDGRHVTFSAAAASLVPNDTNNVFDVFVYDRLRSAITRVSVDSNGGEAAPGDLARGSHLPRISATGRFVTFYSGSPSLAPGDQNGTWDVFVHDRDTDADGIFDEPNAIATRRISEGPGGVEADGASLSPDISADGTHVAFASYASNLVASDTNASADIFVRRLNIRPVVAPIAVAPALVPLNTPVTAQASFSDLNTDDFHAARWNWGDGATSVGIVTETGGTGSVSGTHTYAAAGVYAVGLTVGDSHDAVAAVRYEYVVVYDPSGGFVSGNGLIASPADAYTADPTLTGPARVSFVSKYQKGTTLPTGNTQFDFRVADLSFRSNEYGWLVVAGARAQIKGTGSINGAGDYGFLLSAVDGDLPGGGGADTVRVKIWEWTTGAIVYDNQAGAADDASATTEITGGSIVIHKQW